MRTSFVTSSAGLPRCDRVRTVTTGLTKVVVHPTCLPGVAEALEAIADVRVICPETEAEVPLALADAEVLVSPVWTDQYLGGRLRWIQSHSAGCDQFPMEVLRQQDIVLTSAGGVHIVCAEHAIGLLLTLIRDIHVSINDMAHRSWSTHVAPELGGRTVAIVGLGAIGEATAKRLLNWEVRLIGITRSPESYVGVLEDVRPLSALGDACSEASVLLVALPAAPETRHIVSTAVLDALGDGWVVNVSRGSVIDERALVDRLVDGRLRAAGLDVTEEEPLSPSSPLWDLTNVVVTPHMAGLTPRYGERLAELFVRNLRAYKGQGPWVNRMA